MKTKLICRFSILVGLHTIDSVDQDRAAKRISIKQSREEREKDPRPTNTQIVKYFQLRTMNYRDKDEPFFVVFDISKSLLHRSSPLKEFSKLTRSNL